MRRKLARIACFVAGVGLILSSDAYAFGKKSPGTEPIQDNAGNILSAFQSGCGSIGSWTASAEAQTNTFMALISTIQQRPACAPYQQQLQQISSLSSSITAASSNPDYVQYRQTQEQVQELTLALQGATDPSQISALSTALTSAQVNLATQRGTVAGDGAVAGKDKLWTASGQVAGYMGSLMGAVAPNSSPTLAECLKESPAAAVGMATNLLAMGGSFISPVYGAAASVVGQLVNVGMQIFEEMPYDNAKDSLNQGELPISLSCGLESMSELYCDADDSFQLIQLAASSYDDTAHPNPMFMGLDLVGRRFPVLTSWLTEVENGVAPLNPTQAAQQATVVGELASVESMNLTVTGTVNQAVQFYNASNGTNSSYIVNAVVSLAEILGQIDASIPGIPQGAGGVFTQFQPNPLIWACWIVLGQVPMNMCNLPNLGNQPIVPSTIQNYVTSILTTLSPGLVNGLLPNWTAAYQNVYDFVMVQFSQTITTTADSLLPEAKEGQNNLSPYEVLTETSKFIAQMLAATASTDPRLVTTLQEKLDMIARVQWYIDGADTDTKDWGDGQGAIALCPAKQTNPRDTTLLSSRPQTPEECQRFRLSKIFELFDLKDGVQVFMTDVSKFVTWDLQHRLDQGQLPTDVTEILKTAGIDISLRMESAGLVGLAPVNDDLNNSRKLSRDNLKVFHDFFSPAFVDTVSGLADLAATEPTEGPNRPNGELLGRLCGLWLATGDDGKDFPDDKTDAICKQAKLFSIYAKKDANGHYPAAFDVGQVQGQLAGKSFMDRVCTYHEYLRRERLAEIVKTTSH